MTPLSGSGVDLLDRAAYVAFLGQKPILRVGQAQPLRAEAAAKHPVLRPQGLDRLTLLASQPACDQKNQELKRSGGLHVSQGFGEVFPALPERIPEIAPGRFPRDDPAKNKPIGVAPPGIEAEVKSSSEPENLARSSDSPRDGNCETPRTSPPSAVSSPSFATDDAELEALIVSAELGGRRTVADVLARQLDARRAAWSAGNVVDLDAARARRPGRP